MSAVPVSRRTPEQAIMYAAVEFARALRTEGLCTSVDNENVFLRALNEIDVRDPNAVYWAGHASFVQSPEQIEVYRIFFERFWEGQPLIQSGRGSEHGESDPRMGGSHHGGEALPQFGGQGKEKVALDGERSRAHQDLPNADGEDATSNQQVGVLVAWSAQEELTDTEEMDYGHEELASLRQLAAEIKRAPPRLALRRRALDLGGARRRRSATASTSARRSAGR